MFYASVCAIMVSSFADSPGRPFGGDSREANQVICGARCVQRVLEHYGRREELIDLVRELQGAAIDHPADARGMKNALERRGVSTRGVRVPPSDLRWLDWEGPVIVHFSNPGHGPGHFCVIFPARGNWGSVCVWDGLAGESMRQSSGAFALASGTVLLTAATPIPERPRCLNRRPILIPLGAVLVALPSIMLFLARKKRRRKSQSVLNG